MTTEPHEPDDVLDEEFEGEGPEINGDSLDLEDDAVDVAADERHGPDKPRRVTLRIRRKLPGRRLDKYLHARFPRISRTLLQKLIKQGDVTVNGKPTKPSYEPDGGDRIAVVIPPPEPYDLVPEPMPLDIVYEDDYLLAVNKPKGIIVHPAHSTQTGTLANGLAHYARSLSHGDDPFRPGIVHRLDKNTTGVMLVAKTDETHWRLSLQFERRLVRKTYLGVVEGSPQLDADVIDAPLIAHPTMQDRFIVAITRPEVIHRISKHAVTEYEIVERFRGYALAHLHPRTGRTHQLRVHMSYVGHPMAGDTFYGGHHVSELSITGQGSDVPITSQQALHAFRIRFTHPILEREMQIEAPPPPELHRLIQLLRQYRSLDQKSG